MQQMWKRNEKRNLDKNWIIWACAECYESELWIHWICKWQYLQITIYDSIMISVFAVTFISHSHKMFHFFHFYLIKADICLATSINFKIFSNSKSRKKRLKNVNCWWMVWCILFWIEPFAPITCVFTYTINYRWQISYNRFDDGTTLSGKGWNKLYIHFSPSQTTTLELVMQSTYCWVAQHAEWSDTYGLNSDFEVFFGGRTWQNVPTACRPAVFAVMWWKF